MLECQRYRKARKKMTLSETVAFFDRLTRPGRIAIHLRQARCDVSWSLSACSFPKGRKGCITAMEKGFRTDSAYRMPSPPSQCIPHRLHPPSEAERVLCVVGAPELKRLEAERHKAESRTASQIVLRPSTLQLRPYRRDRRRCRTYPRNGSKVDNSTYTSFDTHQGQLSPSGRKSRRDEEGVEVSHQVNPSFLR